MAATETTWVDETLTGLSERGYRNGAARRVIVELLGRQSCCLTAMEIFDMLRAGDASVGIASVYRVLDLLVEHDYVQRVDVGGGHVRYEPQHRSGEHHHHVVCSDCGRVEAFTDAALERVLHDVEGKVGYAVAGHEVVLHGACRDCRQDAR